MAVQLEYILTGKGVRCGKEENQSAIQRLAICRQKVGAGGTARSERMVRLSRQRRYKRPKIRPGNPDHTNATTARRRGERGNGISGP